MNTSLAYELNRLAGTTGLEEQGAANAWAGTTGFATQGALNICLGTTGIALDGICNLLAGTQGFAAPGALSLAAPGTPRGHRAVVALTSGTPAYVGLVGTTYSLYYAWSQNRYWKCDLVQVPATLGGYLLNQLNTQADVTAMASVDENDASVTWSGTWTKNIANAAAYGGKYAYSTSAGATVSWTSPAGATSVGARIVTATNGGLFKVTINGDATAANLLPTAQSLVTSSAYPSSILVANGGTLNPTDRCLNTYFNSAAAYDVLVAMATGLTAGAQAVVLTSTGYTRTGAGGNRAYISGLAAGSNSTALIGNDAFSIKTLNNVGSAWEYAGQYLPTGATTSTYLGNIHGYEVQDSISVKVDGAAVTLVAGTPVAITNNSEITRTSHLVHPETGATNIADNTVVYRLDNRGLTVTTATTWNVATRVDCTYVMMPMCGCLASGTAKFNKATTSANSGAATTFTGSGDNYYMRAQGLAAWMWDANDYGYAALMWMTPTALRQYTNGWVNSSPALLEVEDRNGTITKIYLTRVSPTQTENVTAGQTWNSEVHYVVANLNGANAIESL